MMAEGHRGAARTSLTAAAAAPSPQKDDKTTSMRHIAVYDPPPPTGGQGSRREAGQPALLAGSPGRARRPPRRSPQGDGAGVPLPVIAEVRAAGVATEDAGRRPARRADPSGRGAESGDGDG
jgi:hypothetical protein